MSKSIADGAKLTPETFADFVERLKYHHRGEGVSCHVTADPIFMVQKLSTIYGLADEYCESKMVHCDDAEWESPQEYWDDADEDERNELNGLAQEIWERDFLEREEKNAKARLRSARTSILFAENDLKNAEQGVKQ